VVFVAGLLRQSGIAALHASKMSLLAKPRQVSTLNSLISNLIPTKTNFTETLGFTHPFLPDGDWSIATSLGTDLNMIHNTSVIAGDLP
jgi:hypothetical protein